MTKIEDFVVGAMDFQASDAQQCQDKTTVRPGSTGEQDENMSSYMDPSHPPPKHNKRLSGSDFRQNNQHKLPYHSLASAVQSADQQGGQHVGPYPQRSAQTDQPKSIPGDAGTYGQGQQTAAVPPSPVTSAVPRDRQEQVLYSASAVQDEQQLPPFPGPALQNNQQAPSLPYQASAIQEDCKNCRNCGGLPIKPPTVNQQESKTPFYICK